MHKTRRRFHGYDYARGGAMFVTTCLEPRRPLFGRVDHERVALSEAGEIAKRALMEAVGHFSGLITLRSWTIMPDHVHLLIKIREQIGADSLGYISIEGLVEAIGFEADDLCLACTNGKYPTRIEGEEYRF